MALEARESLRQQLIDETPSWYNPYLHLMIPTLFGLGIILVGAVYLENVSWWEYLAIPITYFLSNLIEWSTHRQFLHRRSRLAPVLYEQHTPRHHRLYVTDDMSMRDRREFRLTLIPAYGIMLIFITSSPVTLFLWFFVSPNVALFYAGTTMAYVVGYEWLHLSYHLPQNHPVGRLKVIQRLKRHHAIHHDPQLMQQWNLNVTVPIWDWILGTYKVRQG
ncbi:MAG: sterol desaturase family protein [Deltaproteobacteria bacterium]|nr:sterol desaturase family protein [Deltaproteobacteria bacterium]